MPAKDTPFFTEQYNDDLHIALENNYAPKGVEDTDIDKVVAEVPGSNGKYHWWWVIKIIDGRYALLSGWCDKQGWSLKSGLVLHHICKTAEEAANNAPSKEDFSGRNINKNLTQQVTGKQPFALYQV